MEKLEKRNEIRISYQFDVLNILRKGKTTIMEISRILDISFTAAKNIVDDLIEMKLIKYSDKEKEKARGRKSTYIELNCNQGVVCAIDYVSDDARIVLATVDNKIVAETAIQNVKFITNEILNKTRDAIKELLANLKFKNKKLLAICISSPGKIRTDNFEYVRSRKIINDDVANPVYYFANAFKVKVEMYNDVRLGCLAEMKYGSFPKKPFNGIYIHNGFGSALSIVLNGKIYKGVNGFAGESPYYNGKIATEYYTYFPTLNEIEMEAKEKKIEGIVEGSRKDNWNKIIEEFENDNPKYVEIIKNNAKKNAISLHDLLTILDINYVVISGTILKLGEKYIDIIKEYINEFSNYQIKAEIVSSSLKDNGSILGACHHAASIYFKSTIENIVSERFSLVGFNVNDRDSEL